MVSPRGVVSRFLSSSISFTPAAPSGEKQPAGKPGQQPGQPTPEQKRLEQLKKKKEMLVKPIERQITQLQEKQAAGEEVDPNDDPAGLFGQVRPLLSKMGLQNSVINNKTQLVIGQTQGKNSLYNVLLRRGESITPDMISRIKRNESNFKEMMWTAEAISIYVWYPYVAETVAGPAGAPAAPTAPGAPVAP